MMSETWIRVEDGEPTITNLEAVMKWVDFAEHDEVWIPAAHVEGNGGDFQFHVEMLPADVDDDWMEAEL